MADREYAWVWLERVDPKKPRVPQPKVLALRTENVAARDALIAADPVRFFTEPHYAGFPAVLVRLEEVGVRDLKKLITRAWEITSALPPKKKRR